MESKQPLKRTRSEEESKQPLKKTRGETMPQQMRELYETNLYDIILRDYFCEIFSKKNLLNEVEDNSLNIILSFLDIKDVNSVKSTSKSLKKRCYYQTTVLELNRELFGHARTHIYQGEHKLSERMIHKIVDEFITNNRFLTQINVNTIITYDSVFRHILLEYFLLKVCKLRTLKSLSLPTQTLKSNKNIYHNLIKNGLESLSLIVYDNNAETKYKALSVDGSECELLETNSGKDIFRMPLKNKLKYLFLDRIQSTKLEHLYCVKTLYLHYKPLEQSIEQLLSQAPNLEVLGLYCDIVFDCIFDIEEEQNMIDHSSEWMKHILLGGDTTITKLIICEPLGTEILLQLITSFDTKIEIEMIQNPFDSNHFIL